NFTAGLPVVRTSPDHGVGYDIAGQNVADETSFRHALQMAFDVVRNRRSYDEAHNNPIAKRAKNFEDEVLKDEN
ncbi:MAG TPA: 4-hydroxythreonine-4-phosphate dehydrogenase PdxA, partial [Saprospiraceae bacterium]|nr:4-hydroxythreonine-4-phosphate dehydrogenase PdxA [Saprospiraceae bacterium]